AGRTAPTGLDSCAPRQLVLRLHAAGANTRRCIPMKSSLILTCFTISLFSFGCSDKNGGQGGNGNGSPAMATGGGGNGGGEMAVVGGGGGEMATGMIPDLAGLPAPDHDPKQHPPEVTFNNYGTASPYKSPIVYTVVWTGQTQTNGKDTGAVMQAF